MSLYIEVQNGQAVNHPFLDSNLLNLYGSVENFPSEFQPFKRVEIPHDEIDLFKKYESSYQCIDGIWQDVWSIVDMNSEEVAEATIQRNLYLQNELEILKKEAQTIFDSLESASDQAAWQHYLDSIDSWTFNDIVNPTWPRRPFAIQSLILGSGSGNFVRGEHVTLTFTSNGGSVINRNGRVTFDQNWETWTDSENILNVAIPFKLAYNQAVAGSISIVAKSSKAEYSVTGIDLIGYVYIHHN